MTELRFLLHLSYPMLRTPTSGFRPSVSRLRSGYRTLPSVFRRPFLTSQKPPSRAARRWTAIAVSAVSIYAIDEYYYASLLQRSVRAVYVLLWIGLQYYRSDRYENIEELHEIASEKLLDLLAKNKGLYIKQGQAIANQGAVFPAAYQRRFRNMYDGAPRDPWPEVDRVLRNNWGDDYETAVFEYFDHEPIASASIGQVHRAKLKKEQMEVAVKVQHPYIAKQINVDLAVYRGMSWVYSRVFDLPLSFFVRYVSDQVLKEADFRIEAANSHRLELLLAHDRAMAKLGVYVPVTYDAYTRKQVLVTEWIDGVSLGNKKAMEDAKLNIATTMHQYLSVFGRQMFEYGFVHSDPHPGNMLARFHHGKQQLVILDHGLYISLPPKFQSEYRELWKYIFCFDQRNISRISQEWGIESPDLLATMVLLRPPRDADLTKMRSSLELIRMFLGDESRFPRELLFVVRTMRMMQNMNQKMGSPVNRINLLTRSALNLMHQVGTERTSWFRAVQIEVGLFVSNVFFWILWLRQKMAGGDGGSGLEDYIEDYMKQTARSMGIEMDA